MRSRTVIALATRAGWQPQGKLSMKIVGPLVFGLVLALLLPFAAHAAGDPFLGTWRLSKAKSVIATDPGVKSKEFVFSPGTEGVLITETLEMVSENGEKHISHIPYVYGKPTPQTGPGMDTLLVVKADSRTAYWTVLAKGQVLSQLQVNISDDGRQMTFRYLWSAADPTGKAFNDRYVYEKQ
ncbi:hypothetical protein E5A73_09830 [Sphingomonas gei]|uniref:DUF1579 domain-containing protein n=1 Tax=Sphingomonas gei TaxID=1395960 RepID=A0A4S1XA61_9SPHN|nr:hypothetical protein [Sphingomonas gei]TGX53159.1 hypothetical protein E5A73_09830 [Sphingomonas gei]